jgi:hypothetical protein
MKLSALGLVLAMFAGAASAGNLAEPRGYDSNDYSAQVFYRLDFGGAQRQARSLGLRLDNDSAAARGAPSLLQARIGEQGLDKLAVNGVDLRGALVSSGQDAGGGFLSSLSAGQWLALGFTTAVFATVVYDATGDDNPGGSGGSGY